MGKKRRDGRAAAKRGNNSSSSTAAQFIKDNYPGGTYEGELEDGKPHGKGRLVSNGEVYVGEWKEGIMHGKGRIQWEDGNSYDGEWNVDGMHGWGTFTWANDGHVYEGEFANGNEHGRGTYRWKNGKVYEGEFKDGQQHGWGIMTLPSGKVHEGHWEDGKKHGNGTETLPTGEVCEGTWMKGELVQRKLRSQRSQEQRLQKNVTVEVCENCGADDHHYKLRVCSGCNLALYCSAACQQAASRSHRRICDIISMLPSRDSDRLVLVYDKDNMVDLDAGLRYATKYMDNLRHLKIDLADMMGKDDAIKLSPKRLYSLFRSREFGELESVACSSSGINDTTGRAHVPVGFTKNGNAVWTEIYGLKQLRLEYMRLGDVQNAFDAICQQRDTLEVLCLPCTDIAWSRAKCRRTIAQAVGACKQLVKLDLTGCSLMDSDVKTMLQGLSNLRILHLMRATNHSHEFTDNTCGLIARKCPGLQELDLRNHDQISVRGIRRIFEDCPHLRSFCSSSGKLSCKDIRSLLDIAPQLVYLSLSKEFPIVEEELDEIIEATGGRTVLELSEGSVFEPQSVSAKTRETYDRQRDALNKVGSSRNDPGVANEWADV